MSKWKTFLAGMLSAACLMTMIGCGKDASQSKAATPDEARQNAAQIYNEAVQRLLDAQSYTMTGSINSSSVMGEIVTSVVTAVDCRYAKNADGSGVMLMNAEQSVSGSQTQTRTTYVADGKYYVSAYDSNYIVSTNDYGDYDASMIVKRVEESAISGYDVQQGSDGTQIRFEIPYGIYASEALDDMIGLFADDSLLLQPVTVRANIDTSGMLTSIYIDMENSTNFDGDAIEQFVTLSLQFAAYNETTVTAPEGLERYEDRTQPQDGGQNAGVEDVPETFTGDSLD